MKKIRICHFILGFHNGGVEKVLESYFSNMDRSNFELHVVTHIPPDTKRQQIFEEMGFIVHPLSYVHGHKITMQNLQEYNEFFQKNQFDIVHNHFPENLLPLIFAKKYKVPVRILHSHNDYTNVFKEKSKLIKCLYQMGLKVNVHNATDYFACGLTAGESVFGKKNCKNIVIIANAINTQKFKYNPEKRQELRKKLCLEKAFVLGHIGRYEDIRQKNQKFVLKIFNEVLKTEPATRLLMIGDGKFRPQIMELAKRMGIIDKIIFTGAIPNVHEYLQTFDVFVFPSNFEGLGIVAIEAQCSGLPVIASSVIPQEANISPNYYSLSLLAPVNEWAKLVLEQLEKKRSDCSELVKNEGYDIYKEAVKLEKLYEQLYQKHIER
ncbi:hypothetical protein KGMB01110_09300 [Mediterraneibacter butyricigenes]|uniref:Glycosyltransferase subfamily 4-like N-terminal domain-containing protein n=1 Tax=Mediterraneibacter butyricigenes TaxID=2316025 RepID=A0A391NYA2_9FIRM|nr:glycosyltransferase [Mediterraneibacter butyricigenes]GCA66494.1 hypothetical protein KGMB01110_09300 [Mediterraneibacter butyricigenes]